jgi:hypothetical protein
MPRWAVVSGARRRSLNASAQVARSKGRGVKQRRLILAYSYRGHAIRVETLGGGPFEWCYSVDRGSHTASDTGYDSQEAALRSGLIAANLYLDQLYAPGGDSFAAWEDRLNG